MRGDRTLKWLGAALLVLGIIAASAGYASIEPYQPIDVMDTSRARQVVPGVRNELGAALDNLRRRDRMRARSDQSMRNAMPLIYIGGGVGALGLVVLLVGFTAHGRGAVGGE